MFKSGNTCHFVNAVGHSVVSTVLAAVKVDFGTPEESDKISVNASLSLVMVGDGRIWPCVGGEPGRLHGRGVSQAGSSQKRTPSRLAWRSVQPRGRTKSEVPEFWRRMSRREPFCGRRLRAVRRDGRVRRGRGDEPDLGCCVVGGVDAGDSMIFSSPSLGSEDGGMEGLPVMLSSRARNLATMALWRNMKLYRCVSRTTQCI